MTKQFVNKYVFTEKLKGEKTNWQTNTHKASLEKIFRFPGKKSKPNSAYTE